jgi:hypothetical protein
LSKMVKNDSRPMPPRAQYRIGITDTAIDSLWFPNAEKYKVFCRMVHVTKAALHIGYVQMMISIVFSIFFGYNYLMALSGNLSADHWINTYTARYISQLLFAVSAQLVLVALMIHGVRTERRGLLLPYIIYATVAILVGCVQLAADFLNLDRAYSSVYNSNQFVSHLIGTMIHAWCLSVIWRCYGYFGEKKVARQISEQLSATQAAFAPYPEPFMGYMSVQPPPYADTVAPAYEPVHAMAKDEDKQPLTV